MLINWAYDCVTYEQSRVQIITNDNYRNFDDSSAKLLRLDPPVSRFLSQNRNSLLSKFTFDGGNFRPTRAVPSIKAPPVFGSADEYPTHQDLCMDGWGKEEGSLAGKFVRIIGTTRQDLNGRTGMALSFDEAQDRYVVVMNDGSSRSRKVLQPHPLAHTQR